MELQRQDKGLRAGVTGSVEGLLRSCQAVRVGRFGVGREPPACCMVQESTFTCKVKGLLPRWFPKLQKGINYCL